MSSAHVVRRATALAVAVPAMLIAAACGGGQTPVASGPSPIPAPARPALPPGADTCDPNAYYQYGREQLIEHPAVAAAAFYWMQRLAPASPDGYYGQRVALLMRDPRTLRGYMEEDPQILHSARVQAIDSLAVRAIMLDPFFARLLDEDMIVAYLAKRVTTRMRTQIFPTETATDRDVLGWVRITVEQADSLTVTWADTATLAAFDFARGEFRQAAAYWGALLRHDSTNNDMRVWHAQALFLSGQLDGARVELERALAAARRADAREMRFAYDSKVLWQYELGRMHEQRGRVAAARDAYERTLDEDMSFYPAHVRLALLAVHEGDTATAVTELQRAIEIDGDDFTSRFILGLVHAGRRAYGPAAEQLRRAMEIEPWAAIPHFVLANAAMDAKDRDVAATEYRRYLALAARADPNAAVARRQLAALAAPATP